VFVIYDFESRNAAPTVSFRERCLSLNDFGILQAGYIVLMVSSDPSS
jgi:hypothetical protein